MPSKYSFMLGVDENSLTNLELMSTPIPAPYYSYREQQELVESVDGHIKGIGYPSLIWRWASLTIAQRDYLRTTFCTGESASVGLASLTPDSSGAYVTFTAIMVWPEEELVENESVVDFQILFKNMVEVLYP